MEDIIDLNDDSAGAGLAHPPVSSDSAGLQANSTSSSSSSSSSNSAPVDQHRVRSRSPHRRPYSDEAKGSSQHHPLPPRPSRDYATGPPYSTRRSRSRSPRDRRLPDNYRTRQVSPTSRGVPEPSKVLGVFGLSILTKERDLDRLFGEFGQVVDISMITDKHTGKSRGFAFVTFATIEAASKAREAMNGMEYNQRKMRVDFSLTKPDQAAASGGRRNRVEPPPDRRYDRREDRRDERDRFYDRDRYRYDDLPLSYRRDEMPPSYRRDDREYRRYDDRYGYPPPPRMEDRYLDDRRYDYRSRYDDRYEDRRLPLPARSPPTIRRDYGSRSPPPRRDYGRTRSLSPPV
ncbi:hypothetical protein DFJ73DRAFT_844542 [Zopfochytrium polystomum]|nr:hypothetical protein DFJ73DRAFT_844542 [Zopfochytrium polystomum]